MQCVHTSLHVSCRRVVLVLHCQPLAMVLRQPNPHLQIKVFSSPIISHSASCAQAASQAAAAAVAQPFACTMHGKTCGTAVICCSASTAEHSLDDADILLLMVLFVASDAPCWVRKRLRRVGERWAVPRRAGMPAQHVAGSWWQ